VSSGGVEDPDAALRNLVENDKVFESPVQDGRRAQVSQSGYVASHRACGQAYGAADVDQLTHRQTTY
jgi:hypothetical protein